MLDAIKKTLWASADKLRANMDAAEYKHLVLGLIFIKYISDTFTGRTAKLAARLRDPDDEYSSDEDIPAELEDRDYYTSAKVFWVPEAARREAIRAAASQTTVGKHIDDALGLIAIQSMVGMSGCQRIQNEALGRYPIAVPPDAVGLAFGQVVAALQSSIEANDEQAKTLASMRDTLLPRLISGQLVLA